MTEKLAELFEGEPKAAPGRRRKAA